MGALENFRSIGGSPKRVFGNDIETSTYRVGGRWRRTKTLTSYNKSTLQALGGVLYGLPGWPLADGIDRKQFTPYTHQLLVTDTLATDWFEGIGVNSLPRTRVLVSDEGGTGKTLGVSLAVRWITIQPGSKGPVIILVPPLLKEHWARHLRAVFNDDPERVQVLGSARFFDPIQHQDEIVIMSKFSWIHHYGKNGLNKVKSLCVVIDEAHQGRTGMSNDNLESEDYDNEGGQVGCLLDIEEQHSPKTHAEVLRLTCANAVFAIGATATPINIDTAEIEHILTMLGCEQDYSKKEEVINNEWQIQVVKVTSWARNCQDEQESCPSELIQGLITMLVESSYPHQWRTDLEEDDISALTDWLKSICEGKKTLCPKEALRIMRDFHPYGRHLSLVLRVDLKKQDEGQPQQFRTRKERTERIEMGTEMIEYFTNIQRNGKSVGLVDNLGGSTRLVTSHRWNPKAWNEIEERPRYTGDWTFRSQDLTWPKVRAMKDPRLDKLKEQIQNDLEYVEQRKVEVEIQRGCVIFTEFRGTVDLLRTNIDQLPAIDGVEITVFELTGGTDVHAARRCLDECERLSLKSKHYPVLICTPAGEVGLDMEWATTLVHWDLNPNPQRMEQRTWRLDRLISSESTRHEYTIIHMICSNIPHFETLENRINKRFSEAALSLGLPDRLYIPKGNDETVVEPGGSLYNCALLNEEISRLNVLFHGGSEDGWPGPRLREAERLRTASVMEYCGYEEHTSSLLEFGLTKPLKVWGQRIELGDERVMKIRDLEQISTSLSRSLSPQIPIRDSEKPFCCSWEHLTKDQTFLSMNYQTTWKLFSNLMLELNREFEIPVIPIQSSGIKGTFMIAINASIANLSSSRVTSSHDRGLRILDLKGKEVLSSSDEEKLSWDLVYKAGTELIISRKIFATKPSPLETSIDDPRGRTFVKNRTDTLELRNVNDRSRVEAIKKQIEEYGEDDERHNLREATIVRIEFDLQHRDEEISKLKQLDHCLYPLLLLEVNL